MLCDVVRVKQTKCAQQQPKKRALTKKRASNTKQNQRAFKGNARAQPRTIHAHSNRNIDASTTNKKAHPNQQIDARSKTHRRALNNNIKKRAPDTK